MLKSQLRVRILGAANPLLLARLNDAGVTVEDLSVTDELTAEFLIPASSYRTVEKLALKSGTQLDVLRGQGIHAVMIRCRRRPILMFGILLLLILTIALPTRIFFFRVEGNLSVPTNLILEKAAACGIGFGAERRAVRSEKMKNALLEAMPQLQWAGINTKGCVAVISVRERDKEQTREEQGIVSGIVSVCDALIESVTVTAGNAACQPGRTVQAGQLLISGYTDTGLMIRGDRAQGEVIGRTQRKLTVVSPFNCMEKRDAVRRERYYSLIIGKKQINFSKDSGISDTSCDRMYVENYVMLPGGFQLPLGVAVETRVFYDCDDASLAEADLAPLLSQFAAGHVTEQMLAGQILSYKEALSRRDGALCLSGEYSCREMIGRERKEEIITPYGKHDGTDR